MFSSRLPLKTMIELCRVLRHYLKSGLSVVDVFKQQAKRGPSVLRPIASRITDAVESGEALEDALKQEAAYFPPLFVSLASVGEHTGMLPEIFHELEQYYARQLALRRDFVARIAWPVIQFVLATLVLALVIFILGILGSTTPAGKPFDPLGLGLLGPSGAVIFLGVIYGFLALLFAAYWLTRRLFGGRPDIDRLVLNLPAIGPCLRALALGRFCLALQLTHESGMSVRRALRLSLRATGNKAFVAAIPLAEGTVASGEEIAQALERTGLFPDEFLRIVEVAEASGRLTEEMKRQGDHYHEEAGRRLAALTAVAGYGIWALIGLFIILAIFKMYSSVLGIYDNIGI